MLSVSDWCNEVNSHPIKVIVTSPETISQRFGKSYVTFEVFPFLEFFFLFIHTFSSLFTCFSPPICDHRSVQQMNKAKSHLLDIVTVNFSNYRMPLVLVMALSVCSTLR